MELFERVPLLQNPLRLPQRPVSVDTLCGMKMKGFALLHLLEQAELTWGRQAVEGWRASLPGELAQSTDRRSVTSVWWLPVELYYSAVRYFVDTQHQGDVRRALSIGHDMASRDISSFYRVVMSFSSPALVLTLSGRFWRSYFDQSSLLVLSSSDTCAEAEIRDWPIEDPTSLHELAGSLVAWMEASRGRDVRLSRFELTAPGTFRVDAEWR